MIYEHVTAMEFLFRLFFYEVYGQWLCLACDANRSTFEVIFVDDENR